MQAGGWCRSGGEHTRGPDALQPTVRERGGPSLIWLIPILTAIIGAWLVLHTLTDRGPLVTVTFRTAEGIEVDKTRLKYKSLDIGLVESVRFSSDFSRVEVRARLSKDAGHFLRRDTRFWVVRPTLSARGISGLGLLLSPDLNGIKSVRALSLGLFGFTPCVRERDDGGTP